MYVVSRKLIDHFLVAEHMRLRKEKEKNTKTFLNFFNNQFATEN